MRPEALLAFVVVAVVGAGCRDPLPLPEAPGADVVVVGRAGDVFAAAGAVTLAGFDEVSFLMDVSTLVAPDTPVVISVLPGSHGEGGAVVVATRPRKDASLPRATEPVVGDVVAFRFDTAKPGDTARALARLDRDRALVALRVPREAEVATASVLEVMAARDEKASVPGLPAAGDVVARVKASPAGPLEVVLRAPEPRHLALTVLATAPPASLKSALAAPAPSWSCAVDDGAAAVLAVPPMEQPADDDEFDGRMLLAVYAPPADDGGAGEPGLLIAGKPKRPADAAKLVDELRSGPSQMTESRDGERRVITVNGKRVLKLVSEPGVFALATGGAPVERIRASTPCPPTSTAPALARIDGRKLHALLLPKLLTPADILSYALAAGGDGAAAKETLPLAPLRAVERIEIDGRVEGDVVRFDARVALVGTQ